MAYSKHYTKVGWENEPSTATPLNDVDLGQMDQGIDTNDSRIVALDANKLNISDALNDIVDVTWVEGTGIFNFIKRSGQTITVDTKLEKLPMTYTWSGQILIITLDDGTTQSLDFSTMIAENEFDDTDTIAMSVTNHVVTATVKAHSIGADQLETNYLANITIQAGIASNSATAASQKASDSEAWAVGTRSGVDVADTDPTYENNSKHYAEFCSDAKDYIDAKTAAIEFGVDSEGNLVYTDNLNYSFSINNDGDLLWEVNTDGDV